MTGEHVEGSRRTILKTLAAVGAASAGVAGAASAQDGEEGGEGDGTEVDAFRVLSFTVDESAEVVEATDALEGFEVGDEVQFQGSVEIEDLFVTTDDELVASGWLVGEVTDGDTVQVDEAYEDLVFGPLDETFGLDLVEVSEDEEATDEANQPDEESGSEDDQQPSEDEAQAPEPADCPSLDLDAGEPFRSVLGLELASSIVQVEVVPIAGEENLLGSLLCATAHRLDAVQQEAAETENEQTEDANGTEDSG